METKEPAPPTQARPAVDAHQALTNWGCSARALFSGTWTTRVGRPGSRPCLCAGSPIGGSSSKGRVPSTWNSAAGVVRVYAATARALAAVGLQGCEAAGRSGTQREAGRLAEEVRAAPPAGGAEQAVLKLGWGGFAARTVLDSVFPSPHRPRGAGTVCRLSTGGSYWGS